MHVCGSGARNWRVRTHNCAYFIMHEKVEFTKFAHSKHGAKKCKLRGNQRQKW